MKNGHFKEGKWDLLKSNDARDEITIIQGPQQRKYWKTNYMTLSIKLEMHKLLDRCGESTSKMKKVNEIELRRLTQSMTW